LGNLIKTETKTKVEATVKTSTVILPIFTLQRMNQELWEEKRQSEKKARQQVAEQWTARCNDEGKHILKRQHSNEKRST